MDEPTCPVPEHVVVAPPATVDEVTRAPRKFARLLGLKVADLGFVARGNFIAITRKEDVQAVDEHYRRVMRGE